MAPFFEGPPPRLLGHRGAAGEAPENTIEAFRLALAQGAQVIETDVRGTRDGEVVIFHDLTVDRTTNGKGTLCEMELAALRGLDAGYRFSCDRGATYPYRGAGIGIPTLREVIDELPGVSLNIEIKQESPPIVEEVARLVRGAARPVVLAAGNDSIMRRIREVAPDIPTSFSAGEVVEFIGAVLSGATPPVPPGARALQIPVSYGGVTLVSDPVIKAAHRVGVEVHAWTINDADEMRNLLALGVDGIVTDYPAKARSAMLG